MFRTWIWISCSHCYLKKVDLIFSGCTQVGACVLAATTLNPPKLMWTVLIVSLEARHCKNASGNSSKNKEPTALTGPPNFADPNPITIYGMRLNKPIQRRLHPEIHRTQRICCQSPVPHVHSQTGQSSFFFSFFVAWGGGILLSLGFFLLHKTFYL